MVACDPPALCATPTPIKLYLKVTMMKIGLLKRQAGREGTAGKGRASASMDNGKCRYGIRGYNPPPIISKACLHSQLTYGSNLSICSSLCFCFLLCNQQALPWQKLLILLILGCLPMLEKRVLNMNNYGRQRPKPWRYVSCGRGF